MSSLGHFHQSFENWKLRPDDQRALQNYLTALGEHVLAEGKRSTAEDATPTGHDLLAEEGLQECPNCGGDGYWTEQDYPDHPERRVDCPPCRGTGTIPLVPKPAQPERRLKEGYYIRGDCIYYEKWDEGGKSGSGGMVGPVGSPEVEDCYEPQAEDAPSTQICPRCGGCGEEYAGESTANCHVCSGDGEIDASRKLCPECYAFLDVSGHYVHCSRRKPPADAPKPDWTPTPRGKPDEPQAEEAPNDEVTSTKDMEGWRCKSCGSRRVRMKCHSCGSEYVEQDAPGGEPLTCYLCQRDVPTITVRLCSSCFATTDMPAPEREAKEADNEPG